MRAKMLFRNPFKSVVLQAIRSPQIDLGTLKRAFMSLPSEDRDCIPYVPRLLALEGLGESGPGESREFRTLLH